MSCVHYQLFIVDNSLTSVTVTLLSPARLGFEKTLEFVRTAEQNESQKDYHSLGSPMNLLR